MVRRGGERGVQVVRGMVRGGERVVRRGVVRRG